MPRFRQMNPDRTATFLKNIKDKSYRLDLQLRSSCTIFAPENYGKVKVALITILLVGISVLLLGVRVFFIKGGKFPNTHIHNNPALKEKGITCVTDELKN